MFNSNSRRLPVRTLMVAATVAAMIAMLAPPADAVGSTSGWFYSCNYSASSGTGQYAYADTRDLNGNCTTLKAQVKYSKSIYLTAPYYYSSQDVTTGPVAYSQANSTGYAYQGFHYVSTVSGGITRTTGRIT